MERACRGFRTRHTHTHTQLFLNTLSSVCVARGRPRRPVNPKPTFRHTECGVWPCLLSAGGACRRSCVCQGLGVKGNLPETCPKRTNRAKTKLLFFSGLWGQFSKAKRPKPSHLTLSANTLFKKQLFSSSKEKKLFFFFYGQKVPESRTPEFA